MPFRPKRLSRVSVDAPRERRWDVMGEEEATRLHAMRQAEELRFSPLGPRTRKRALRCFVLTPIGFACLGWLFVSGNVKGAVAFFVAGLLLGGLTYVLRPLDYLSGLVYALAGVAASFLIGHRHLLMTLLVAMLCGSIGIAMGRTEELRRLDCED